MFRKSRIRRFPGILLACLAAVAASVHQADAQPAGPDRTSVHDVQAFGARGDGVTDDTTAIQRAVDTASAAGGGRVYLPGGTYPVSRAISVKDNVWIHGDGMGTTVVTVRDGFETHAFQQIAPGPVDFVRISDLTVDGNADRNGRGAGIVLRNCRNVTISGVEVRNVSLLGIFVSAFDTSVNRVLITESVVRDTGAAAGKGQGNGISVTATAGNTLGEVIISNNLVDGIGLGGGANQQGILVSGAGTVRRAIIESNIVTRTQSNGIEYSGQGAEAIVHGNYVYASGSLDRKDGGNGIFCSNTGRVSITGNVIDGVAAGSDNGIEVSGARPTELTISMNRITNVQNPARACIAVGSGTRIVVNGNHCYRSASGGIEITTTLAESQESVVVGDNLVEECTGDSGIALRGRRDVTVTGNVVKRAGVHGILVREGFDDGRTSAPLVEAAPTANVTLVGNVCLENARTGIFVNGRSSGSVDARRIVVGQNVSASNGYRGLTLANLESFTVSGNIVENNQGSGIRLSGASHGILGTNVIRSNGLQDGSGPGSPNHDGILLEGATRDIVITGNQIADHANPSGHGIRGSGRELQGILLAADNAFSGNGTNVSGLPVAGVRSASYLTLPAGEVLQVTGTSDIESIAPEPGRRVTLVFDGRMIVRAGIGNLFLNGNLAADRNDALTVVCDGTHWFEVSRIDE